MPRFAFRPDARRRTQSSVADPAGDLFNSEATFEPGQQHSNAFTRRRDRRKVLAWFAEHTGTAHDCARALGMLPTSTLPRVTELRNDGCLVRVPGVPRKPTGLGGTAAVLIVTAAGLKELRA